ncbi:hypothetical protein [Rhizobium sp. CCGE531]|uniref:hypothetical protein n=1 Tax=Rhizobium sp. CCGE531 TaxID=2364271 RepID=UPI001FE152DE|nr:hypothetical protein [Rhizobium sp. CCGE531]
MEKELLDAADAGRVVYRIWIGFAGFALLILCLSWGAAPNDERPQVAGSQNIGIVTPVIEN